LDITIRKNEHCIVGLPRCDFVFSSTRTCFVAYGFKTSPLEMTIIKNLLEHKGIQCEEAGGKLAPGQNAFCQKICSKIITSQFCIILLNHDEENGKLIPNANVNMEYGLMLGFNKYLIPFQHETHSLPFNVAGLDTVKYDNTSFESKASVAIDLAIEKTRQDHAPLTTPDEMIELFLLSKKALYSPIDSEGVKNIFRMGSPFGFNLLHDFSGMTYIFLGNFTALRPEIVIWRLHMLNELLKERKSSLKERIDLKIATEHQIKLVENIFAKLKIWLLVTSDEDKAIIMSETSNALFYDRMEIFSIADVKRALNLI
jgi:hypothetical protein